MSRALRSLPLVRVLDTPPKPSPAVSGPLVRALGLLGLFLAAYLLSALVLAATHSRSAIACCTASAGEDP